MSGDDSFDPRSWTSGGAKPPASPELPANAAKPGSTALPDAWKAVLDDGGSAPPPAPPVSSPAPRSKAWMLYAALVLILAGAGATWILWPKAPASGPPPAEVAASEVAPAEGKPEQTMSSRSLVIASIADLSSALAAAGLTPGEVSQATQVATPAMGGASGEIRVVLNIVGGPNDAHLDRLQASFADGSGAVIARDAAGKFAATRVTAELSKQIKVVRGELDSDSFYSSAVAAGVTDSLIPEFVNAFSFDFNLAADVKPGDTFEVAYEQSMTPDGQPVGQPQLLYASLVTATKRRALYRFKPADEEVGWYDGNGASTVRSFMRTPIEGARITSNFGMRFHPVLHYTRLHGGTDFAAPVGTPIYASADGTVVVAGPSGGCAGTRVILQHKDSIQTYYFHMSHVADGLAPGAPIKQGTSVGLSGATGGCITGPHLHYEVHINGEKVDPMTVVSDAGRKALEAGALAAFKQQRDRVDVARARQAQ
jgi:murein DD-endopeptidase MepM/ murein hydrolase activator NlpD